MLLHVLVLSKLSPTIANESCSRAYVSLKAFANILMLKLCYVMALNHLNAITVNLLLNPNYQYIHFQPC